DRDGNLWVGINGGGLCRWEGDHFAALKSPEGLPSDIVLSLYEDRGANLWVGTRGGLVRLNDGPCTPFTSREGLPAGQAWCVLEDTRGDLWVGTNDGVSRRH